MVALPPNDPTFTMIKFNIASFTDPTGMYSGQQGAVAALLSAAASTMNAAFFSKDVTIDIAVAVDPNSSYDAYAGAANPPSYIPSGAVTVIQPVTAQKIQTGVDTKGSVPDATVTFSGPE